ncbi:MAG: alkaline phosphatase family protein [Candidatus Faecivicinus sp.]
MRKHLIIVSVDAMVGQDLELLSRMPSVGKLLREGSLVKRIQTIYPSLTHPVHASLMSGCPAGKTGVPNNVLFAPGDRDPAWFNSLDQMKCDTLLHAAHRAGLTTAVCRWPMTAGGFDVVDYLVPEVMDSDAAREPDLSKLYAGMCSPALQPIIQRYLPILNAPERHPSYEIFSMRCAADIIREFRPNLLLTHPGMVDHCRHVSGLYSAKVDEALRMTDEWIGWLMQAVEDAGISENTAFAIVSDHGHMEKVRTVAPNVYFAQQGYIRVDADGEVADWDIYAVESGLSCHVYIRDERRKPEFEKLLNDMCATGLYGFGEVLSVDECRERYGLEGTFSFVLEGDGYTEFSSDWLPPMVRVDGNAGCGQHHSSHGHRPEKGPQPPMLVCGAGFRKGVLLESASILDEAPTFARLLGIGLRDAQGSPIAGLLEQDDQ